MIQWLPANNPIRFDALGINIDPPVGLKIGPMSIYFYGVIIAIGLCLAVWYGLKRSRQFGLKQDDILDGVIFIVPFAIICARAYYCIFEWDQYRNDPISVFYIWKGGLAIYGGVIGAAIGVILFSLIKKVRLGAVLDLVALGFLIGQSIGRWGNFINREAHGGVTELFLGMNIADPVTGVRAAYHPTFLYESLWNAAGFVLLHFLSKKRKYDGQIALGYVAWYGLGRTLIEGLRTDSLYIFKEQLGEVLRVSQLLAAVSCFAAVVILVLQAFRTHSPEKLYVNIAKLPEEEKKSPRKSKKASSEEEEELEELDEILAEDGFPVELYEETEEEDEDEEDEEEDFDDDSDSDEE